MEKVRREALRKRAAKFSLWLFGFLAVVSVFSLIRESLEPSWPLLRACVHSAVLVLSTAGMFAADHYRKERRRA